MSQMSMQMERMKEPTKKASWGLVKERLKCGKCRIARAVMQRESEMKRVRLKMNTMVPMVRRPG